jgi:hypothetical protein
MSKSFPRLGLRKILGFLELLLFIMMLQELTPIGIKAAYLFHISVFGFRPMEKALQSGSGAAGLRTLQLSLIERIKLIAYEFYRNDQEGVSHLIGILPERRKKPERITRESIMNWGRKIVGDSTEAKNIYFIEVSV